MSLESQTDQTRKGNSWKRIALAVCILVALFALYRLLPIQEWIETFQNWVKGYGVVGWFIFIAVYAITSLLLVPGSFLTVAAGLIWGLWAFPIVLAGAVVGSAISFLAARHLFYDRVQARVADYPKFNAVNKAIGEEGWKVVFLLRLSPAFPFSLQNWFLGITTVPFWPSQIATFFGILPGTLLYVWAASFGGAAASDDMSIAKYVVGGLGVLSTLIVTIIVTRKANEKLKEFHVE